MGTLIAGRRLAVALGSALAMLALLLPAQALAAKRHATHRTVRIHKFGELDCNGFSRRQHAIKHTIPCADIAGRAGVSNDWIWNSRFHDNGHYIGHDEPDMTFLSNANGSGNDVTWVETLPRDPAAMPTVAHPGSDVTRWFELSAAPWFSMAQCDSNSYPQLPCEPRDDGNAPSGTRYPGAGSAFMEMQFYPPGFTPVWTDGISCDDTHWCAAMTIDSLECTTTGHCNGACVEPVNFAFIQRNGVPTGPPAPQNANTDTFTPNGQTLMMNPGDQVMVHLYDAPVEGAPGQMAFKAVVSDLTTGASGVMQASARNGFQNTSIVDCSGTPHNFEPEYNTAKRQNITPWAALQTNISTQYEIGHFEPCTSVTDPFTYTYPNTAPDTVWSYCHGPYEDSTSSDKANGTEITDAPCYPKGYTHGSRHTAPIEVTGCIDEISQNGDLDFDGSSYWADWPLSTTPTATFPGSFVQQPPKSVGRTYSQFFIQTDAALSESTCTASGEGCAVPPPNAPGKFYPYFSRTQTPQGCVIEFGNVSGPGMNTYGMDAQYGTDQQPAYGYPEFIGPVMPNNCTT